jgi:pimeloyl-ACP methyl ester carboxylesterase
MDAMQARLPFTRRGHFLCRKFRSPTFGKPSPTIALTLRARRRQLSTAGGMRGEDKMPAHIAIIHGWSDDSKSFRKLRDFLIANGFDVTQVFLTDYISMDDDVRVEDVAKRMEGVLRAEVDAGRLAKNFDLIVHSTGGLVAREWVTRFYPDGSGCPAKRIVMLAPANFGSALAALGKSMIGRIAKGWNNWLQTGTEMLRGLELASPYQWGLACRDILDPSPGGRGAGPYGADKVWPFVIVGSRGYPKGLRQIVNENGSDGTVRAAAANLNAVGMTIDFASSPDSPEVRIWHRRSGDFKVPFAVLPDRDHSTIVRPEAETGSQPAISSRLGQMILAALSCGTPARYAEIQAEWAQLSEETAGLARNEQVRAAAFDHGDAPGAEELHQYFQIVTRVRDDHGQPVSDYFLEFFAPRASGDRDAIYFQKEVLEDVHVNKVMPSLRCLYADRNDLLESYYPLISQPEKREVAVSISAAELGRNVRYFDKTKVGARGNLIVHRENQEGREALAARLFRNTTHLVEIVIPRQPIDKVFRFAR